MSGSLCRNDGRAHRALAPCRHVTGRVRSSSRSLLLFQQGLAEEGDHLIHRASCGLVWRIYQVAGKDGMRRLSLSLHAGGICGTVGQLRAGERGAEGSAQGLETRCPADSVSFETITAQL